MRIGIIDFGTNTLRLDIFEAERNFYTSIYDNAIFSHIIENTSCSALSQEGIEHVIQAIEEHQRVCRHYRCDRVECFATASLRYINNANDVLDQVEFRTGIKIKIISGNEEAVYDYRALKSVYDTDNGIGCDLGGGSMQLFIFDKDGPIKSVSLPLGSSRIAKQFVSGPIPIEAEIECIKSEVKKQLYEAGFMPVGYSLSSMGGTAKAFKKLCRMVLNMDGAISLKAVLATLEVISAHPEEAIDLFEDIEPKRSHTIAPGIAVLASIMEYMGCTEMNVFSVGVREGFLEKVLEDGEHTSNSSLLDII